MVNMHEAKTHLSRLVARAQAGEQIIIARDGQPVAQLVAYSEPVKRRTFGRMRGQIEITDDFDAPLPPELQAQFEELSDE
jgi:prevent-host-death family protein